MLFSGGQHLSPTLLYGIKLGYDIDGLNIADSIGIEATANYFSTKSNAGAGKVDGFILRADTLFPFTPGKTWVPFVAAGLGVINTNDAKHLQTFSGTKNLLLNYGAGVKYFWENWLAVRVDFRHLLVYQNINTKSDFELTAGLTYLFGKEHKKKVKGGKPVIPKTPAVPAIPDIDSTPAQKPGAPAQPSAPQPQPGAPGAAAPPASTTPPASKTFPAATTSPAATTQPTATTQPAATTLSAPGAPANALPGGTKPSAAPAPSTAPAPSAAPAAAATPPGTPAATTPGTATK